MKCKACQYPLWQIVDRRCPECGTPFAPSEFEFILNSVRFLCPHCEQDYYGTGEKGHLVPRTFACVRCARFIDMDQMILLPTAGIKEEQTEVAVLPWVDRRGGNWLGAFFVTMWRAMVNPYRAIEAVPEASSWRRAAAYMAIHVTIQQVCSLGVFIVGAMFMAASAAGGMGGMFGMAAAGLVAVVVLPLLVLVWGLLAHVILRMTGATAHGPARTLHAVCYSAGNNCTSAIPCIGVYIGFLGLVWWSISAGFMLARGQQVRAWRGVLATLLPLVIVVGTVVGGIAYLIITITSSAQAAMTTMAMPPMYPTHLAAAAGLAAHLQPYTWPTDAFPSHAAELLTSSRATPPEFILPGTQSTTLRTGTAGFTLNALAYPIRNRRAVGTALANDAAARQPAYRVGDWVFTYNGLKPSEADQRLWLAIGWPDPAANTAASVTMVAIVGPQGAASEIAVAEFAAALAAQNELRATRGLVAIVHPKTIASGPVTTPPTTQRP